MSDKIYDVVVIGGGFAGAILASELAGQKKSVLVLEGGTGQGMSWDGYEGFLDHYYQNPIKVPNSPYPYNPASPQNDVLTDGPPPGQGKPVKIPPGGFDGRYWIQKGPSIFASDYSRTLGGTSLHWLGILLRMCPHDFRMKSTYHVGVDWPITYEDLEPWYAKAEWGIGTSANVEDQAMYGVHFPPGYDYPMERIPQSWLDQVLGKKLEDFQFEIDGDVYDIDVVSLPSARNSMPRRGYVPRGAVGNPDLGQRCQGNASCIPICPVQAKWNSNKLMHEAIATGHVELRTRCVASEIQFDENQRVSGVVCKLYTRPDDQEYTTETVRGRIYVVAAHAVESAKLLLASGACPNSKQLGRNLMDHPYFLTWALMNENVAPWRGPFGTSGIPSLRDGRFRQEAAACRIDVGNWGWDFPYGSPITDVTDATSEDRRMFGTELRSHLAGRLPRQFRLGACVEQLPEYGNRVTIDPAYRDNIGNFRPVIEYTVDGYTAAGFKQVYDMWKSMLRHLDIDEDNTTLGPDQGPYVEYAGQVYNYRGSGHLVGTHRMGGEGEEKDSCVNVQQRCWDHDNLYLAGCGNMPTIGTSNPSLTMAALTYWCADNIAKELG